MPSAARVVSLLTFFGPAKKVSRLPAGTGELDVCTTNTESSGKVPPENSQVRSAGDARRHLTFLACPRKVSKRRHPTLSRLLRRFPETNRCPPAGQKLAALRHLPGWFGVQPSVPGAVASGEENQWQMQEA
jgi:hypothetical protein